MKGKSKGPSGGSAGMEGNSKDSRLPTQATRNVASHRPFKEKKSEPASK